VTDNNRQVVRLTTSYWSDKRGLHVRKSLITLRRESEGYQILDDDSAMGGAESTVRSIENLDDCPDGVYLVRACNMSRDHESGVVDGYDLRLEFLRK
jgi:hypothetical protein